MIGATRGVCKAMFSNPESASPSIRRVNRSGLKDMIAIEVAAVIPHPQVDDQPIWDRLPRRQDVPALFAGISRCPTWTHQPVRFSPLSRLVSAGPQKGYFFTYAVKKSGYAVTPGKTV